MKKYRINFLAALATYILVREFNGGEFTFQLVSGDEVQPNSVMIGRAQLVEAIMAENSGELAHVHLLRLHLFDADHVDPEAADPIDPRLLELFPYADCYVLGEGAEVYSVRTGKVIGHLPEKVA